MLDCCVLQLTGVVFGMLATLVACWCTMRVAHNVTKYA